MNIIIAMILMVKGGNDYLKVINKYYPAVMREYNNSEDSIDIKLENLEKKLLELKESSPAIVVDAIMKRETISQSMMPTVILMKHILRCVIQK